MGQRNKQRRVEKRKRAARSNAEPRGRAGEVKDRHSSTTSSSSQKEGITATEALSLAVDMVFAGFKAEALAMIELLVDFPVNHVDEAVEQEVANLVVLLWENGYQPADLHRMVRVRGSRVHLQFTEAVITQSIKDYEGRGLLVDAAWENQVAAFDSCDHCSLPLQMSKWRVHLGDEYGPLDRQSVLQHAVEFIALLRGLPLMDMLRPPPSKWAKRSADGQGQTRVKTNVSKDALRMLGKIRALLAKAESTSFAEEAESMTAKAQELMARYEIDQAMLHAHDVETGELRPESRRLDVIDPYAQGKATLLQAVAMANCCRSVWHKDGACSTVVGFAADLEMVELLYTSLLVQGTSAMINAGSQRDSFGRSTTRSFRQSFLYAFAHRIGKRLEDARAAVVDDVVSGDTGSSLLPVLASQQQAVDNAYEQQFSSTKKASHSISNRAGWIAGNVAADAAVIDLRDKIESPTKS